VNGNWREEEMRKRLIKGFVLVVAFVVFSNGIIQAAELSKSDQTIFKAMETELNRSMKKLKMEKDRPYFIAYTIVEK